MWLLSVPSVDCEEKKEAPRLKVANQCCVLNREKLAHLRIPTDFYLENMVASTKVGLEQEKS